MCVLVINSGSSSIKYRVYSMDNEALMVSGIVERIGEPQTISVYRTHKASGEIEEIVENLVLVDHAAGLKHIFALLGTNQPQSQMSALSAIGHRVVHGGDVFQDSALINDQVINGIRNMTALAPLHNTANLAGIETAGKLCPDLPQVAVFDSAFFRSLPAHASRYALPEPLYKQRIRRYGFHGISHQYVARQAADFLQQPLENLRVITLHLGNGASAAAIEEGVCIDTSMGMTPLEGLIMGTRCGDIDPSIPFYLARSMNMSLDDIETLLNHKSGMKGLCGASDMREVHHLADAGNEQARLAIEMYCYRIVKYVGAYFTILGGLDALVFTAGIGEHDSIIRQSVCNKLSALGIRLDHSCNQNTIDSNSNSVAIISDATSRAKVLVIPTNEELEIARQTLAVVRQSEISGSVD